MDIRSSIQYCIGVDIGVPLLEVFLETVGTTPFEITAVRTHISTARLPVMPCSGPVVVHILFCKYCTSMMDL